MSKELKENRVVLMMSDADLRAVDDYRFANRIPTRAKAMRMLLDAALRQSPGDRRPLPTPPEQEG